MRKLFFSLFIGYGLLASLSGQNPVDSARHLFIAYSQARDSGNFLEAATSLEKIISRNYPLSDYNLALVHNALGFTYYETGRAREALRQYREAEGFLNGNDPNNIQLRISIHINQALYHSDRGDHLNSLEYNNKALRLLEQVPAQNEISLIKLSALQLNKGIALYNLGQYDEAFEILKQSEQTKIANDHSYLGSVYYNLARLFEDLGQEEQSIQYYLKGIHQWISEYDSSYYELANLYQNLGQLQAAQGDWNEGLGNLATALQIYQLNYGQVHPLTAGCYAVLAENWLDQGSYKLTLDLLQNALHSSSGGQKEMDWFKNPEIITSSHPNTLLKILSIKTKALQMASVNQSRIDVQLEFLKAALSTNQLSIDVLYMIQESIITGASRIMINAKQKDLYTTGIQLNLKMNELTSELSHMEAAYVLAARGKSNELMFELNRQEWLYLESLSDSGAVKALLLRQQIEQLSNQIQIERIGLRPDSIQMIQLEDQLFQTRDSFSRQLEQLQQKYPQIERFESITNQFNIGQVRRNLNRNETLVEYYIAQHELSDKRQLYAFAITKKECHVYETLIDSTFFNHLETITRNLHAYEPYGETFERYDSLKTALYEVYQLLVRPLTPMIKGKDLVIVPDEWLSFLPFEALITLVKPEQIINYAGLPYLLNDYSISYMYNSQLLKRERTPLFQTPGVTAWIPEHHQSASFSEKSLNGALDEVEGILSVMKGTNLISHQAKSDIKRILQQDDIIHLAMHSLSTELDGSSPYFVLDTIDEPGGAHRMYDYEINALLLSTPMVVLSSCETAGGKLQMGEGIISLSRSFLQAGAGSVVHTMWPVDDMKSKDIMIGFYKELKQGVSKGNALSNVKKVYLEKSPPVYTHPYYWAAFQVTGDTSPLFNQWNIILAIGPLLLAITALFYLRRRNFFSRD